MASMRFWVFANQEFAEFVCEAIRKVGYTDEYRDKFGVTNAISGSD